MNNNEWITDRQPTMQDADRNGYVWASFGPEDLHVWPYRYEYITLGMPWMPLESPKPYVYPKRFVAMYFDNYRTWGVKDTHSAEPGLPNRFDCREAAERIAAIYNEVME